MPRTPEVIAAGIDDHVDFAVMEEILEASNFTDMSFPFEASNFRSRIALPADVDCSRLVGLGEHRNYTCNGMGRIKASHILHKNAAPGRVHLPIHRTATQPGDIESMARTRVQRIGA